VPIGPATDSPAIGEWAALPTTHLH